MEKLCSNSLAMLTNMTKKDMEEERKLNGGRRLAAAEGAWPEWLSPGDRRLLQSSSVTPNVVVAADGSGDHKTVAAAVAAAPEKSTKRFIIRIKAGVYRENVEVPKKKTNIMFLGDGRTTTIITGSKNVKDGSTTFNSATVGEFTLLAFSFITRVFLNQLLLALVDIFVRACIIIFHFSRYNSNFMHFQHHLI